MDIKVTAGHATVWDYLFGTLAFVVYFYGWVVAPGWMKLWCLLVFPAYYFAVERIAQILGLL